MGKSEESASWVGIQLPAGANDGEVRQKPAAHDGHPTTPGQVGTLGQALYIGAGEPSLRPKRPLIEIRPEGLTPLIPTSRKFRPRTPRDPSQAASPSTESQDMWQFSQRRKTQQ